MPCFSIESWVADKRHGYFIIDLQFSVSRSLILRSVLIIFFNAMNSPRSIVAVARLATKSSVPLRNCRAKSSTTSRIASHLSPQAVKLQNASRAFHTQGSRSSGATGAAEASNPAMAFPCLDALESKSATLEAQSLSSGPEPSYTSGATLNYHCNDPLLLDWGGLLPEFDIAYETWGEINADKSNVILLHTGLSASSHAHSTESNPKPGWWEKFIGPGGCLNTNKYHIICTNVVGGCYGSTGPSSIDPADGKRYATRFPILTMEDMVRAQFRLLDGLGINKLYASVGSSMGGMQSLAAGVLFPGRVGRIASISGCARSHPYSIAMRHTQRQVLMMDPKWNRGFYYDSVPPHAGMKLAREIATVTYRSGPEWEQRFGRRRADPSKQPALCPDFLIETYLDHAGEKFCLEYDPNSLLYVSKAMDLFDLGAEAQAASVARRAANLERIASNSDHCWGGEASCSLTLPDSPYQEQPEADAPKDLNAPVTPSSGPPQDLILGLQGLQNHPALVMGVESDILFPAWQQREIAETLRRTGNKNNTPLLVYNFDSDADSLLDHEETPNERETMAKATGIEASELPVEQSYKADDGELRDGSGSIEMTGNGTGDENVNPEVLEYAIQALEGKKKHWYTYMTTADFWVVLAIGQILSLCITATNTFSTLLVNVGTSIPAFQTLFNYILLTMIYTTYTIYTYGWKKYFDILKVDGWKYIILSFMDVQGNYFTVLAYRYTNLLSAQLLNFWSIVCVVIVSFTLLRVRYKWAQIAGIVICCGGMGMLLASDHITSDSGASTPTQVKGDLFGLVGATFYGLSNVFEEWFVSKRPMYEVLGMLGFFGVIINGITAAIFDRESFVTATWDGQVAGYIVGYTLALTIFYTLAPLILRMASAAFFDISLLTGNFWGVIIGIQVFGYTIYYLYPIAFVMIILGLVTYFLAGSMLGDSRKPWLGQYQEDGIAGLGTAKLKAVNEARREGLVTGGNSGTGNSVAVAV
ncbi:hypothetical protein G7Y89_g8856 [Cudoniella acicularis]|uniref:AB hydrolase-1 domain-containing protein n=1 Tax=Cudoniella acicularis TaxID=354080 RepID=A0A8H4W077_9HELO|nr:hypothetical protein G7Y89_g8856 [Cudoniella acicularis]